MSKKALGKGLQALLPSGPFLKQDDQVINLSLDELIPNSNQPRMDFDEDKIRELAESISEHGVVQPIIVRPLDEGKYEIVVGERRWRASRLAGKTEIPCVIKEYEDKTVREIALIENIQRENLNPIEEAAAYHNLLREYKYTQEKLAARLGKTRVYIANTIRLANLPLEIQAYVRQGLLSAGHARAILTLSESEKQGILAEKIIKEHLTVRQAEELAKALNLTEEVQDIQNEKEPKTDKVVYVNQKAIKDYEGRLRDIFSTKVKIKSGEKGGRIEIDFYDNEDLERITALIVPEDKI